MTFPRPFYSAIARLTSSFMAWKPEKVKAWCAAGVENWPKLPNGEMMAPGIVACGEFDVVSYQNSLSYFQAGRGKEFSWAWISLRNTGHQVSNELDKFVRKYFEIALSDPNVKFDARKFD